MTSTGSGNSPVPFPSQLGAYVPNAQQPLISLSYGKKFSPPKYVTGTPPYILETEDQVAYEKELLTHPTCNPLYLGDISPRTYQLNIDKETIPNELVYDSNYQSEVQCTISGMVDVETKYLRYTLKKAITDVRKLDSGVYGSVYEISVRNYPWFVVKAMLVKDSDTEWDLILNDQIMRHGAVVGLFAINKLRSMIPTFMHTYGIFTCGLPKVTISSTGIETVKVCDPKERAVSHVILENIRNAPSMKSFCVSDQCSASVMLSIILQLVSAIRLAHREVDFTHYDLSLNNVLIETTSTPIAIKLTGILPNSPPRWHQTTVVARIVDFDMAHAVVGDYHVGELNEFIDYGIDRDRSHPGYDIIKFITLLAAHLDSVHRKREVFQFYEKWRLLSNLYAIIQVSLSLEQRVAVFEVNVISGEVMDFIKMGLHPVMDFGQGLAENQIIDADNRVHQVQQRCEVELRSEIFDFLPANTINTAEVVHNLLGWRDYTKLILDERRLPGSIVDYFLAVNATKKYTRDQHQADVLEWLRQINYQQLFNTEYQGFYQEILNAQGLITDQGPTDKVVTYVDDIIERGTIWIGAVQASAPPELLGEIERNYIPGLELHFEDLRNKLESGAPFTHTPAPFTILPDD